jgi:adenylate cyclase class 2
VGNSEHGVIERERKYKLGQAAAGRLRARLDEVGRFVREERQDTIVLEDRASHLKKGSYLRFRTVEGRAELTHKGPKQALGKDKWRLEHTVALGDGPALELLEKMGFRPNTRYVKDTAIFLYRGVLVSVDRIIGIGWFCEMETDDLEKDLDAVAAALELDDDAFETRGYPTIATEAAREKTAARA